MLGLSGVEKKSQFTTKEIVKKITYHAQYFIPPTIRKISEQSNVQGTTYQLFIWILSHPNPSCHTYNMLHILILRIIICKFDMDTV